MCKKEQVSGPVVEMQDTRQYWAIVIKSAKSWSWGGTWLGGWLRPFRGS